MGSSGRAALQAGVLVALADAVALRRAWGSAGERVAIALAVAALVVGAALALAPWLALLVDGGAGRGRARSIGAALVAGIALGVPLATTATAQRTLGLAAPLLLPLVVALALAAIARAPRAAAAAVGAGAIVAELMLPRRLYPSLRVLLVVLAFAALACALRRIGESRPRHALVALVALTLLVAGHALAHLDANTRFVTHAQAPSASLVLDAIAVIHAPPPRRTLAATHEPAPNASDPRFAHTGSLADAHLVLVTVDALRADRLPRMPALAALAARGVLFTRAYAVAPSTAASVTALMTARDPGHLDDRPPTLAERLRAAGWNTADFYPAGLFFDGGGALTHYAESHFGVAWADTRTLAADALTDAALARVRLAAARGEPRSFFWLHYFDPHEPYERHELPASASAIDRYDAEVRAVDRALARLVDGLAAFARPTLLVVTADHGEEFGEHGGAYHGSSLYDEQLRVPLVVALLGGELVPERVDAPFSLVDLAPMVSSLLEAGDERPRGDVHATLDRQRMIVRGRYKLVRDTRRDVDELYDLDADAREQHNLADARPDVAAPLAAALEEWMDRPSIATLAATVVDRAQSPARRAAAARDLGAREAYAGRDALRAALDGDDDAAVRAEAALALAQLTDRHAGPPLARLLGDERFADRAGVMLGRLRDPAAAARLAAICRRPPADGDRAAAALRRDAAHYLGFVGDAGAVDALFTAAADPRVRGSAYLAVGRLAARLHDVAAAARLRARLAVEDRADARVDLIAAVALADTAR
jgi:arylsulfatase A-like enzyme